MAGHAFAVSPAHSFAPQSLAERVAGARYCCWFDEQALSSQKLDPRRDKLRERSRWGPVAGRAFGRPRRRPSPYRRHFFAIAGKRSPCDARRRASVAKSGSPARRSAGRRVGRRLANGDRLMGLSR